VDRVPEHIPRRAIFHDPPAIHDRDGIADARHHAEFVAQQQHAHPEIPAKAHHRGKHLVAHRGVEGGRRFIRHKDRRAACDRRRDDHTLSHAP
jgi:hypothetical protein